MTWKPVHPPFPDSSGYRAAPDVYKRQAVQDATNTFFSGEQIESPDIRVSHVIKGRIPEAIHKPANQLLESDKTIRCV